MQEPVYKSLYLFISELRRSLYIIINIYHPPFGDRSRGGAFTGKLTYPQEAAGT